MSLPYSISSYVQYQNPIQIPDVHFPKSQPPTIPATSKRTPHQRQHPRPQSTALRLKWLVDVAHIKCFKTKPWPTEARKISKSHNSRGAPRSATLENKSIRRHTLQVAPQTELALLLTLHLHSFFFLSTPFSCRTNDTDNCQKG